MKAKQLTIVLFTLIIGCGKSEQEIIAELESINSNFSTKLEEKSGKALRNGVMTVLVYAPGECETGGEAITQGILSDPSAPSWAKDLTNYGVISFSTLGSLGDTQSGENNDQTFIAAVTWENQVLLGYEGGSWKYIGTKILKKMLIKASDDEEGKMLGKPETTFKFDFDYMGGDHLESAISES